VSAKEFGIFCILFTNLQKCLEKIIVTHRSKTSFFWQI
jgi:hypothetical protein